MPGFGDQHNNGTSINPFEPKKSRLTEYTAKEIATLSTRLEKQLGPEYISSRPGAGGGKVHYLAAEKCINLANDVFGFNGWSSAIQNIQIDFVDESQSTGKVSLGLSVIVRVTLQDGTYHEDIGYGHIENCKGKAAAFEKAKKEGTTDGLKRALRNFGNLLGNCIYDKDYVAKVTKLKCAPTKWDPDNLHRHPDYASVKKETVDNLGQQPGYTYMNQGIAAGGNEPKPIDDSDLTICGDGEDEFGSDGFDEADFNVPHQDHPDHVFFEATISSDHSQQRSSVPEKIQMPSIQTPENPKTHMARPSFKQTLPDAPESTSTGGNFLGGEVIDNPRISRAIGKLGDSRPVGRVLRKTHTQQIPHPKIDERLASNSSYPANNQQPTNNLRESTPPLDSYSAGNHSAPIGFYTARAAESVQSMSGLPTKAPAFDPHLESPSIRKTVGVDHSKTKPVGKDVIVAASPAARPPSSNFVSPQTDKLRRIGMPIGAVGPLHNRNSYKPPQMKRPGETPAIQSSRLALSDVTSNAVNTPPDTGGDFKRPRMGDTNEPIPATDQATTKR